jgi:SPP1 gp7 family putative phage head morphogenesis protein
MFQFSEKQIQELIRLVFRGAVTDVKLPTALYHAIADYLKKGLYKGYGFDLNSLTKKMRSTTEKYVLRDLELLAELRTNVYLFSAAKTYQQIREMGAAAIDSRATVTPFKAFEEKAQSIFGQYNRNYLQTEYDTCIGQAQSAAKWRDIEREADILPMLMYDAVQDKHTSEICRPLDGLTAPVNDPVWKKIMPLNHFNCRCVVRQYDDKRATPGKKKEAMFNEATEQMQDLFKMNPGQDGYIFSKAHPYFQVASKDRALAKRNFDLPIPKKDK